ncbi:PepSY domain-containing protein [Streptomyces thermoalcalitolerans]|uniref:PepSY domain-containing protein n=1 Tax=Streptomyces thermoalcalitolerans TaxID=65605 RepID=A0ABP3Z0F5_9ACTN
MKRKVIIAAAAAAVLIGGGTATALTAVGGSHDDSRGGMTASPRHDRHDGADDPDDAAGTGTGRSGAAAARSARVSVQDALAAALKAVPGTVSSAKLDRGRSGPVWEVEVLTRNGTEYDVTVDATNARVLSTDRNDDRDDGRDDADDRAEAAAIMAFRTDARAAAEAALAVRPGTVTSVDADDDDDVAGRAGAWEVEIRGEDGRRYEVTVDASTGKAEIGTGHHDDDHDDKYDD